MPLTGRRRNSHPSRTPSGGRVKNCRRPPFSGLLRQLSGQVLHYVVGAVEGGFNHTDLGGTHRIDTGLDEKVAPE